MLEPAEQVVAGLLQEDVVVSFISAVWVIVITDISQPVHFTRKDKQINRQTEDELEVLMIFGMVFIMVVQ